MAHLVEFPLAAGGSVLVEVAGTQAGPATRGGGRDVVERARQGFEEAIGRVRPAIESVIGQLRALAETPDEVRVQFGLDLHAEAGAFIAAAGTTANFAVALTWRRGSGTESDRPRPEPGQSSQPA